MNHIRYWENFDPKLNKRVTDFVHLNKYNLPKFWNKKLSEEDNIQKMIDFYTEFPEEMNSVIQNNKVGQFNIKIDPLRKYSPVLTNIGGTEKLKSF